MSTAIVTSPEGFTFNAGDTSKQARKARKANLCFVSAIVIQSVARGFVARQRARAMRAMRVFARAHMVRAADESAKKVLDGWQVQRRGRDESASKSSTFATAAAAAPTPKPLAQTRAPAAATAAASAASLSSYAAPGSLKTVCWWGDRCAHNRVGKCAFTHPVEKRVSPAAAAAEARASAKSAAAAVAPKASLDRSLALDECSPCASPGRTECPICFDPLGARIASFQPCAHAACIKCANEVVARKAECPICRTACSHLQTVRFA